MIRTKIIGDFGMVVKEGDEGLAVSGTLKYIPHQEISQAGQLHTYTQHQDVHAYGVTLLELMYQFLSKQDLRTLTHTERIALSKHGLKHLIRSNKNQFHSENTSAMIPRGYFEEILKKIIPSESDRKILLHIDALYRDIINGPADNNSLSMGMVVKRFENAFPKLKG